VYMFIFWVYLLHMRENMWPLSFWTWLTSLNDVLQLHSFTFQPHGFILSYGWIKHRCVCVCIYIPIYIYTLPFLNPSSVVGHLVPKLDYCEQCCNKHWCASVSVVYWLTFLRVYAQAWYHWIIQQF
jgi:hypothetical protein